MLSRITRLVPLLLVILPGVVTACEGECIVGITKAFESNYTYSVNVVMRQVADDIAAKMIPNRQYFVPPISMVEPIISEYKKSAYSLLETAIFPGYFHGKCQRRNPKNPDGPLVNPPGCPNPDCPVVCGTPGSLVHFYSKLRFIAYNTTEHRLQALATPGTKAFGAVMKAVMREKELSGGTPTMRRSFWGSRLPKQRRDTQKDRDTLKNILRRIPSKLEAVCGGIRSESTKGLPNCSWEKQMKEFILSFP
ncbi:hypothetical protein Hypma_002291 [Hypsizygus marmoreus]|uniref:Uncharacterized protein n=1 Tax=Hypsizygus marmoreus TaxID=39966 RepID=A0A369K394_HYPMA|nr:hypothetical protein Hypma_002291 [Hypsizygus marmoreus]